MASAPTGVESVAEAVADEDALYRAVLQLAERDGMTNERLEASPLFDRVQNTPPGWTRGDKAAALGRLVAELVNALSGINLRSAARVALNVVGTHSAHPSALARLTAFAEGRGNSERTVRNYWYDAARALARTLSARIDEVNVAGDWPKYRVHGTTGLATSSLPPYRFARIDSSYWFRGRVGVRSESSRRVVALEDGVDHVTVVGRYYSDPDPRVASIEPRMNCTLGNVRRAFGSTIAEVRLPRSLRRGEEAFLSFSTDYQSDLESEPIVTHEVVSESVGLFVARVQFDPDDVPERIWYFSARTQLEALIEPRPGDEEARFLSVSELGYVEHRFHDCVYGVLCGLAWRWDAGS